jgi:hypothetical protein
MELGLWSEGRAIARGMEPAHANQLRPEILLAWMSNERERALELLREHVANALREGDLHHAIESLSLLADFSLQRGVLDEAVAMARQAADLIRKHRVWMEVNAAMDRSRRLLCARAHPMPSRCWTTRRVGSSSWDMRAYGQHCFAPRDYSYSASETYQVPWRH